MKRLCAPGLAALSLCLALAPHAAGQQGKPAEKPAAAEKPVPKERTVVTHASVTIDGQKIPYSATAGTLLLYDPKQEPTAIVFYIAYTEDGAKDAANRPVTFAYNGGPGGASALVDIGGFGPRRIVWPAPGDASAEVPPYRLVNNEYSIFKSTDLVFIDAVGTGYSRIVGKGRPKMFYGIGEDGSAFAQFIERYVSHFGRWNSPKFLLGESYGTTRNAVLAQDLVAQGVYLNGVIMCSTVLNFETLGFSPGNDLPYVLYLPSYAAAAWYHQKLNPEPPDFSKFIAQVEQFAAGPYVQALFAGGKLPAQQKQQIAQQLAQFTAVPESLWLKSNLRIALRLFRRRVEGSEGPATGRYDSRFTLPELQALLPIPGRGNAGASSSAIMGALTATFDDYVRNTLDYKSDRLYTQLSFEVNRQWNFKFHPPLTELSGGGFIPDVGPSLARAMTNDPGMHVLFNNGYYELSTPFFTTEYTVDHLDLTPSARARIQFDYYPVGHMLYVNPKALPMLQKNIDRFIQQASTQGQKG